jgi:hypothetical protein
MTQPQTAADPESATYPYSREEFEAIRECVQSVPRGLLRAARRHIQALDAGAFAGGTPKQNAHDDIKNLAEWVSAGLTLECGAVARDHLAKNRLRHPVKLGQHVTPGDLGASPFQTSFDELMTCLGNFEMAYRHALDKRNRPPRPSRGPKQRLAEEALILAIREAWLYAAWPEGAAAT